MDLDFTSEQTMLRDSAAKFFVNECNFEKVKHIEETEEGYSPELWQKVAELGWTGMYFPEDYGGYGGTFMDLVIIQEEIGKAVFPSPFFSTVIQCGLLILEGGTEEQKTDLLGRIAEGSLIMALAQYEPETDYSFESITMTAEPQGRRLCLEWDQAVRHGCQYRREAHCGGQGRQCRSQSVSGGCQGSRGQDYQAALCVIGKCL